jgi:eukaryotic-like serine/threonine-protein kinase
MAAVLAGVALLGGLAWALSQGPLGQNASGTERVEVPGVVGLTPEEAQNRLEGAGLEIGARSEAPSDQVGEGAVAGQDPAAGTEAERGTAVDLVVSTGPEQTPQSSPSATPSASPSATSSATSTATSPASPESGEEAAEEQQEAAEKAADEAQKRREEAAEEAGKALEEVQKEAEKKAKEKKKD